MSILIFFLKVAVSSSILNILYRQSYNLLFFYLHKPYLWIAFVGSLGIFWFLVGSYYDFSFNVVCWSAIVAFAQNVPPKSPFSKSEMSEISDSFTEVSRSVLKSRAGLVSFALGNILGLLLFWGESCTLSGECHKFFW